MGVPPGIGDHIDVRVCATVLPVWCTNFDYSGRPARSIYQVMAIGITAPERRTVPSAQCFFAGVGDQRQLTIEHPDEFVLMTVPMALAGPRAGLNDSHVHAELSQPRRTRQRLRSVNPGIGPESRKTLDSVLRYLPNSFQQR